MQAKIIYDIDYSELENFVQRVRAEISNHSNLEKAISAAGKFAVQEWIRTANAKFTHSEGSYVRGILEGVQYPFEGDPLVVVIENQVPHAYFLEHGINPFDMKKMLTTSTKVRVSKDGKRYLIIPFRHGIPSATSAAPKMPKEIYKEAKDLRQSVVVSTFREGIVQRGTVLENPIPANKVHKYVSDAENQRQNNPETVKRNQYVWGERLTGVGGKYEGMYRFSKNVNTTREQIITNTPLGKFTSSKIVNKTDNNTAYSHYLTFRVMSEDSLGWNHSGIPAKNILKETVERIEAPILLMLKEAVDKDLEHLGFS